MHSQPLMEIGSDGWSRCQQRVSGRAAGAQIRAVGLTPMAQIIGGGAPEAVNGGQGDLTAGRLHLSRQLLLSPSLARCWSTVDACSLFMIIFGMWTVCAVLVLRRYAHVGMLLGLLECFLPYRDEFENVRL